MDAPAKPASPLPPGLRWLGPPLAACFACGTGLRRAAYNVGLKKTRRAPLPVLSVGNLSVGGTGKTPAVACLAQGLLERGRKPAVVMRGYGAKNPGEPNDEARELATLLPGVPVILNAVRYEGACAAQMQGFDVVLLDDGFQHWQLARDLDVVLLDATDPWGGGHLLPWGRLREGPSALRRAHAVVLTRCDLAEPAAVDALADDVKTHAPDAILARGRHAPAHLRPLAGGDHVAPDTFKGKRVLAACGLGHPQAFFETLRRTGVELAATRAFADHHPYSADDLTALRAQAQDVRADAILVTEKDAAKLSTLAGAKNGSPAFWSLAVRFEFLTGADELWQKIEQTLTAATPA